MQPTILFRVQNSQQEKEEIQAAQDAGFKICFNLGQVAKNDLVLGRYSFYPFYSWIVNSIEELDAKVFCNISSQDYVSDLGQWTRSLKELTPETWIFGDGSFNLAPEGPYVVKGACNSRKFKWNDLMLASNKQEAVNIACQLSDDGLIGQQKIYFRKYIELKQFLPARWNSPPVSEEYRFFVFKQKIIVGGFYWSSHWEEIVENYKNWHSANSAIEYLPDHNLVPKEFLQEVINRIGNNCVFYALDVARTAKDNWTVIELNDGQQSGLSMINPKEFYQNLYKIINETK